MSSASVPLRLLDEVLSTVADALHDRPVQSLVAARLLIETAVPAGQAVEAGDMLQRGVQAVSTGADLCRELMWALTMPEVRATALTEDLTTATRRALDPTVTGDPSVRLTGEETPAMVTALARAVHLVGVDARLGGRSVVAVHIDSDAEQLQARMTVEGGAADGRVWLELAQAHLHAVAGRIEAADPQVVLTVPHPG